MPDWLGGVAITGCRDLKGPCTTVPYLPKVSYLSTYVRSRTLRKVTYMWLRYTAAA